MIPIVLQRVQRIAADVFSVPIAQISAESSAEVFAVVTVNVPDSEPVENL